MNDGLYHERIVAAAKRATGHGRMDNADASVTIDNPLCGDRVTLELNVNDDTIQSVGHVVRGCLLCEAAATVIAESAAGTDLQSARQLLDDVADFLRDPEGESDWPSLAMFEPVRAHKSRHECVVLPFRALRQAVEQLD
jgi:nitrogen fixation NifU-like protein